MFVCQSLLKEWRRPPTGGLREAFKESLGGGVSTSFSTFFLVPLGEVKNDICSLCCSLIVETMKVLVLIGSKTLSVYRGAFLKEELLSVLNQLRLEQRRGHKGGAPKSLTSRIPQMRLKMGHLSFTSDKARVTHSVKLPLENIG